MSFFKRKRMMIIILVSILLVIEIIFSEVLFSLILIAIIFLLIIFRDHFLKFSIIIIISIIVLFPSIFKTFSELFQSNVLIDENIYKLNDVFIPNSGKEVLPDKVNNMLFLLHSNKIKKYQISDAIRDDTELYQRIIESAWPIFPDDSSLYRLSLIEEANCQIIDQYEDIVLEYCP